MALTRRDAFKLSGLTAAALCSRSWIPHLEARAIPFKIGAPDWSLRKEADVAAVELAKRLGFDGLEISLGVGTERLPLADAEVQQRYLEESRKQSLPLASTCLNILHRNYLKSDPLGKRWVADSIPITKALGARVILLPFFGKGALATREEMDYVGDFLKEVGPEAEKAGVILGLENTNSAEENVHIMERAKSPAVLVYYDIGNSTGRGYDIVKEIKWLGKDRICEFHLKDNPSYLGQGKIDMPRVADTILEIGFTGWAHLETSLPHKNVEQDFAYNLGYVRGLFSRS